MLSVSVKSKIQETANIVSLELVNTQPGPLPAFTAGAHIDVHLPNGLMRQYSLCNAPTETHRYQIAVLKEPASRGGSQAVHELIKPGDTLHIGEPKNLFPLNTTATTSLLFAGGIGVTPMLAMAETLAQQGANFQLHYCARSQAHAAFIPRIQAAPYAKQAHCHFDDGSPQQKLDAVSTLGKPEAGVHIYVCGPQGFMDYILNTAEGLGWPAEQLHKEYFSAAPIETAGDKPFTIEIKSTGERIEVPADKSAAAALEEAGHFVPLSCEQGICGACLTNVLAGEPEHRDQFLTDEEQASNTQFTPCCSRAKSECLVLDL